MLDNVGLRYPQRASGCLLYTSLAKIDEILAHRVRTIEVLWPYDKLALADVFRTRGSVLACLLYTSFRHGRKPGRW